MNISSILYFLSLFNLGEGGKGKGGYTWKEQQVNSFSLYTFFCWQKHFPHVKINIGDFLVSRQGISGMASGTFQDNLKAISLIISELGSKHSYPCSTLDPCRLESLTIARFVNTQFRTKS